MNGDKQESHKSEASPKHESYDYCVDVETNGEIYCSFSTPECDYTVYFNPNEYSDRLALYPLLLHNSYGFGFFQFPKEGIKAVQVDLKIKHTIEDIICNFYSENPNPILLYHCDYTDGRQDKRSKKFRRWYEDSVVKHVFIKHEIEIEILNDGKYTSHYIGYLCSAKNKEASQVDMEFESFAVALANDPKQ